MNESKLRFMQVIHKPIKSHYELFCLALILLVALQFRLVPISRGLAQDEIYTAIHFVDAGSVWNIMSTNRAFNNHVGYLVIAHLSEILFGRSESALRFPASRNLEHDGPRKYYIKRPLVMAVSLAEIQKLGKAHKEARCVYYEASWQDPQQTEIAQFLFSNAPSSKLNDSPFFIYRNPAQVPSRVQSSLRSLGPTRRLRYLDDTEIPFPQRNPLPRV